LRRKWRQAATTHSARFPLQESDPPHRSSWSQWVTTHIRRSLSIPGDHEKLHALATVEKRGGHRHAAGNTQHRNERLGRLVAISMRGVAAPCHRLPGDRWHRQAFAARPRAPGLGCRRSQGNPRGFGKRCEPKSGFAKIRNPNKGITQRKNGMVKRPVWCPSFHPADAAAPTRRRSDAGGAAPWRIHRKAPAIRSEPSRSQGSAESQECRRWSRECRS